jgi:hypothetical protein
MNNSERSFKNACDNRGWRCTALVTNPSQKTHDFDVSISGFVVAAEVKEFGESKKSASLKQCLDQTPGQTVVRPITDERILISKVNDAGSQLASSAGHRPTILVLQETSVVGTRDWNTLNTLRKGRVAVPPSVSAVVVLQKSNATTFGAKDFEIWLNPCAAVRLPKAVVCALKD